MLSTVVTPFHSQASDSIHSVTWTQSWNYIKNKLAISVTRMNICKIQNATEGR